MHQDSLQTFNLLFLDIQALRSNALIATIAAVNKDNKTSLSYRDAGVDIDSGNQLVENIKPVAARTRRPGVMQGLGGFGALFDLAATGYKNPVLVSGTDGVGTKLKLAIQLGRYDTIGIDLVAMCVNDLLVQGAEPLFFLDYYASGALKTDIATDVITGIGAGCELAGAALIGGETAEMPDMYASDDFDLAGFCVGVVEKDQIIDGTQVSAGNSLIALGSSGPHSNGYSLVRKIIEHSGSSLNDAFEGSTLGEVLLRPTRIYVKNILALLQQCRVLSMSHITGGGLLENIPRVIPADCKAIIDTASWQVPAIFEWLQRQGNVEKNEMFRTFNCGVGMVLVVAREEADMAIKQLNQLGENAWLIGQIESRSTDEAGVILV